MVLRSIAKGLACMVPVILVLSQTVPSKASSHACSAGIDRAQVQLDAVLAKRAAAGPFAKQSTFATLGRQPTPATIASAEAQLGDWQDAPKAVAGMREARDANARGDNRACLKALKSVRSMLQRSGL